MSASPSLAESGTCHGEYKHPGWLQIVMGDLLCCVWKAHTVLIQLGARIGWQRAGVHQPAAEPV